MMKAKNYYLKKIFTKKTTWIVLLLFFIIIGFLFFITKRSLRQKPEDLVISEGGGGFFGRQLAEYEGKKGQINFKCSGYIDPKISNVNDFFACVFPNLISLPALIGTFFFSPLAGIFGEQFDDIGEKTQTDGTDLFFLSTEIPTSRKQIFCGKVVFLTSFFLVLHLILFSLPLALLLGKANYFSNFTGLQTFLFLGGNFLITPLLLLVPLVIFLFSLASLKSVWYAILKWFGRLSVIFIMILGSLVFQALSHEEGMGKKILEGGKDFSNGLSQKYLLTTLTIMGVVIFLALFTLFLAYKDYQKKDLH